MADLAKRLEAVAGAVERQLERSLPPVVGSQARLHDAMRHATLGGGKRLRPFLVVASGELFAVPAEQALRVGVAIELIHGYSLVHDDLPAMDDAELRRGRPSCHRQFDEATAVLAGDALQSLAFTVLADAATHPDAAVRCTLVAGLARAAGAAGMCGGQMIDLEAEGQSLSLEQVLELQRLKTGALIRFACEAGAILAGAPPRERRALAAYAADLGLAFQIQDDLLDVVRDSDLTGKDQGRDQAAGKATLVALLGVEPARRKLEALQSSAGVHLDALAADTGMLRDLFAFVISRAH
jgi:farnesyl diphosphate synthase